MHEILRHLPEGARVLDLGSRNGSFDASLYPVRTVRLDLEMPMQPAAVDFVRADASALPFADKSFYGIIANHSLEHFEKLEAALEEMGRVIKPCGAIFIAVPDASTFEDRLYRWLARGGGHVNAFRSRDALIALLERHTHLRFAGGRLLMTSLSFLNGRNWPGTSPKKLLLLGAGSEGLLRLWNGVARPLDRWFHTRLTLYGWALYFGNLQQDVENGLWSNVCVRCGSGASSAWLESCGIVKRNRWLVRGYECPTCSAWNIFTVDE
jgi:SAM-dependent methyltransferase